MNNSDSDNQTWAMEAVNDALRYLTYKYYFNERTYIVPNGTVAQQMFYNLPPLIEKVIDVTVTIGGVLWTLQESPSRRHWDELNVINFYQDFPAYFFIWNNQVGIFPIPSSAGDTITINYKQRFIELTQADVTDTSSSQTMSATNGSATITASGAVFLNWMVGQWIKFPFSSTNSTSGDNNWYQIDSITDSTHAVLKNQYTGSTITGASFTIGQVPLLFENYQDLPLYRAMYLYYTTRFPDPVRAQLYQKLYDDGFKLLDAEFGSKTTSVVLPDTEAPIINPNLFQRSLTSS